MYEEAKRVALEYQDIFGKGNFFLELQDHGIAEQHYVNPQLLRMSEETGIELICTNDVHYTYADDADAHDILLCIQTGKKVTDENRMRYTGGQYYLKSPEEMSDLFKYAPQAIANTEKIAQRCNVEIEFGEHPSSPNLQCQRAIHPGHILIICVTRDLRKDIQIRRQIYLLRILSERQRRKQLRIEKM